MPILVKIEPMEVKTEAEKKQTKASKRDKAAEVAEANAEASAEQLCNETFNVAPTVVDETVAIAPSMNETVTIAPSASSAAPEEEKNPHDSLMTEDNDESMEVPLAKLQKQPSVPLLKLKKTRRP